MPEYSNAELVRGLRAAADFLESKPEMPSLENQALQVHCYGYSDPFDINQPLERRAKRELRNFARVLGSFTKTFSGDYVVLRHEFSASFALTLAIDRATVCKKTITWDCPDEESLLREIESEEKTNA